VVAIATAYSATVPAGEVISQDPAAGTLVAPGSTVTITVSLGVQVIANDGGGGPDPKHYEWELFIARQAIRLERERREQEKALEKAALVGEQKPQQIEGIKQDSQERLQELAALESLVKKHSEPPEGLATGIREAYISVSRQADSGAVELLMLEIEAQQREEEELLHFAVMLMMH
jgi:hypothetical protein